MNGTVLGIGFTPGGVTGAGHLGVGVNYWFKEKIGLQTGVQRQVVCCEALVLFRIGLTFR